MLQGLFWDKRPTYSQEDLDILRLIRSENVGPRTFISLINMFGNATNALDNVEDFARRGGRAKPIKLSLASDVEKEIQALDKAGAYLLTYKDPAYSSLLLQIPDFPPVISYKGNKNLLSSKCIAIVGARNSSVNGKVFAGKLAAELASQGVTLVSGLARGIDTAAHKASLSQTIGVIAGGIDHIYPPDNTKLFEEMAETGLIIAELPVGSVPLAQHFPQRNRIISGLSLATVVVEASLKSGSLITARLALEQNREVFAVPGFPMDPRCHGTNKLIKEGAHLLESADDIFEHLSNNMTFVSKLAKKSKGLSEDMKVGHETITQTSQNKVIEALSSTPIDIATLLSETQLHTSLLYTILLEFELAGRISRHPGGRISLVY